jgi:hypothetical protein
MGQANGSIPAHVFFAEYVEIMHHLGNSYPKKYPRVVWNRDKIQEYNTSSSSLGFEMR